MDRHAIRDLLLLGLIWGASFLFIKIGIATIDPFSFAAARVTIGAATLWLVWRHGGAAFPRDRRATATFAVLGLVGIALPFAATNWGTQFIPSGLAAILNATMPLFTVLLAVASHAEILTARCAVGVCCGFAGIVLLSWPKLSGAALDQGGLAGETALVGAAVCSAAGIVYARHRARDYSPLATSTGQITAGALWLLPLWLAQRPWAGPAPSWQAVAAALAIGVLGTGVAYVLYYRLLAAWGASGASLVTYLVPIFGIFWGWAVLGEHLPWQAFAALGAIATGLALVNSPRARRALPREAAPPATAGVGLGSARQASSPAARHEKGGGHGHDQ